MFKGQTRKEEDEQTGHHRIGAGGCNYPSGHCLRQSIIWSMLPANDKCILT